MKELQILDVIGGVADDLVLEAKEAPMMKTKNTRPLRIALIAAAITVLMTVTVLGVYAARNWDQVLLNVFHIGDVEQSMMDQSLADVYATAERNGCTYTIKQVMGDEHCMVVSLDVKLPDNITIPTVSTAELKSVAEQNGYDWTGVVNRLHYMYGYEETDESLTGGVFFESEPMVYPVEMDEETLVAEADEFIADHFSGEADVPMDMDRIARARVMWGKAAAEFDGNLETGEGTQFGGGLFHKQYIPETNTLEVLVEMHTENDVQGRTCTLVLDDLAVEDVLGYYAQPYDPERYENNVVDRLLTEPLVMNFVADYTPIKQSYDILQDGAKIGTMDLSPFSAYLSFPLEPDDTVYSSLEAAANAENRKSYLDHSLHAFDVTLTDGSIVTMQMQSAGMAYEETAFFMADRVIDLDQIESITLGEYSFALNSISEANRE